MRTRTVVVAVFLLVASIVILRAHASW